MEPVTILTAVGAIAGFAKAFLESRKAKTARTDAEKLGEAAAVIARAIEHVSRDGHSDAMRTLKKEIAHNGRLTNLEEEVVRPIVKRVQRAYDDAVEFRKAPLSPKNAQKIGRQLSNVQKDRLARVRAERASRK